MSKKPRKTRKIIVSSLVAFLVVIFVLELGARFVDPAGYWLRANQYAEATSLVATTDDARGYLLIPFSQVNGHRWQATINENGQRVVPDTTSSDCTVTAIGDSITFGSGVADHETWVNLLAHQLPTVHFVNAGVGAYNIQQIAEYLSILESDAFVFLSYDDDALPKGQIFLGAVPPLALTTYFTRGSEQNQRHEDMGMYRQHINEIAERENILIFAFDSSELPLPETTHIIPRFTETLSPVDIHPNAQGHQQIYQAVLPHVESFVSDICG